MGHYNKEKLLKSLDNNKDFLKELEETAIDSLNQYKEKLKHILGQASHVDLKSLKETVHAIKGMSISMRFDKLQQITSECEYKISEYSESEVQNKMDEIIIEIDKLLNEYLK